jgi:hypothetical protein
VVTEETVIKEYNPYKELGLMGQLTSLADKDRSWI